MKRIHLHWSAGSSKVSAIDKEHYHYIVDGEGVTHSGNLKPEANDNTSDGSYVAHTRGANTGAIGISMACMAGAKERPFDAGSHPMTEIQLANFIILAAELAETYDIPVTRETILTHSEIQPTLGIAQRGKWDINWVVGMDKPGDPIEVGDMIRTMIAARMGKPAPVTADGLKKGDSGDAVEVLQKLLADNGYAVGNIDGDFGKGTRGAVLAAQADNGLETHGIATAELIAALRATPAPVEVTRNIAAATIDVVAAPAVDENPRKSLSQSTTIRAQVMQWLASNGAGVFAAWNATDDNTRYILAGLTVVGFLAGVWVFRERIRKW